MTRLACLGLLAVALTGTPAAAFNHGNRTVLETVYLGPATTSYVVPSTYVLPTSYLVPTSSVIYRPTRYVMAPTSYRLASTSYSYRLASTSYVERVLPTRYALGSSLLSPTRYYVEDVIPTVSYSYSAPSYTSYTPTTIVYEDPLLATAMVDCPETRIIRAAPSTSAPAATAPRSSNGTSEPGLSVPASPRPGGSGGAAIESQPESSAAGGEMPLPEAPADVPGVEGGVESGAGAEPSPPAPDLPAAPGDEGFGLPLPEEFETSESMRPSFGTIGSRPLTTLAQTVVGLVRDDRSGTAIPGATVTFTNAASTFEDRLATTDSAGRFQLDRFLPDGDWTVMVRDAGDASRTRTYPKITISRGRIYDSRGQTYSRLVLDY